MKKIILVFLLLLSFSLNLYSDEKQEIEYIYKLYQNKYYEEAVSELRIFIKKYPDSKHYNSAINILGTCYYALKKYNNAENIFKTLITSEFKNNSYYYLVLIAIKKEDLPEAEEKLKRIDEKYKLKPDATYFIAYYYYKKDNFDKAESYFKKVVKYKGNFYEESLLRLGLLYYKNKEYVKVNAVLEEYIKKVKTSDNLPTVYFLLGDSNDRMRDSQQALKYYKQIEINYKESEYYSKSIYNSAKLYNQAKDYEKLKNQVNKLDGSKYEKQGLILLAEFEYSRKDYARAEKAYEKILKIDKKDHKIIYKLVLSLMKQKKYDKVLAKLPEIKDTEYKSEYYYYTGFILYQRQNYKDLFEKLIEVDKEEIKDDYKKDIFIFLAESAYNLEKYDVAKKYYNKLYLIENEKKYLYQSILVESKRKDEKALEELFDEYKNRFYNDKEYKKDIYTLLAELYVENKKYEKAEKMYKEYLKFEKDEIIINNLIAVLLKQNEHKEMLTYLDKREDTIENMYLKGVAHSGLHDYEKASQIYKKIIRKKENNYTEKSYNKLIEALFSLEEYKEVIKYSSWYLEKEYKQYKTAILNKQGLSYLRLKNYREAVNAYQELKKSPDIEDYANFMLGEIYYNQKEYEMAKNSYEYVILYYPVSQYRKISLYWIINITYQNKDYDRCLEYIKKFLKNYPDGEYVEEIVFYLGDIYIANEQINLAIKEYEKLFTRTKDEEIQENIVRFLVKNYCNLKKYDNAMEWVKKSNNHSFKTLWMGIILEKQGKGQSAIEKYKDLSKDEENGDKANYYLGSYYLKNKQYKAARKYLERVLDFEASEFKDDAVIKIGLSYEEEKNYRRSITTFMKIKLLYEDSPFQDVAYLKIAENYEKLNEKEKSIKEYLEFFEKFKDSPYYERVVERLLIYYLNKDNKKEAKKYHNVLRDTNPQKAKKYQEFF